MDSANYDNIALPRASIDRELPSAPSTLEPHQNNNNGQQSHGAIPPAFNKSFSFGRGSTYSTEPQTMQGIDQEDEQVVQVGFDEAVMRHLCDIDVRARLQGCRGVNAEPKANTVWSTAPPRTAQTELDIL